METSVVDKKKIIEAIRNGLLDAKNERDTSRTITSNRCPMSKWDFINTSVYNSFSENDNYFIVPLDRKIFALIMLFDRKNKILYTIMRQENFNGLIHRPFIEKSHYIDAMLYYNSRYQENPYQLSLIDADNMFSEGAEYQIQTLADNIKTYLNTDEISKYITIVIDFTAFTLTAAEAVFCSKWLDVLERDNWNEYIAPIYEEAEDTNDIQYNKENEIKSKIKIKPVVKHKRGLA